MVFILEGSTNGIQIKLIRDNQSIATSKVELYDGNNNLLYGIRRNFK